MPDARRRWRQPDWDLDVYKRQGFGIPEAIVAAILTTAIVKALLKVKNH